MTTPPGDPTAPGYGTPAADPQTNPYGPGSGYEGATNGFGQPFVPLSKEPDDLQRAAAQRAAQAQWQQGQPNAADQPTPYGQPNPYAQPTPYGQNPYQQQPNPYGPGGYPQQYGGVPPYFPQKPPSNGLAIAAMVLGIISIPGALFSFFDLPIAIVGLVLAIVALKKSKVLRGIGRGAAVTGLVTSLVGLMLATAMSVYVVNRISKCSDYEIGSTSWSDCIYQQQQ